MRYFGEGRGVAPRGCQGQAAPPLEIPRPGFQAADVVSSQPDTKPAVGKFAAKGALSALLFEAMLHGLVIADILPQGLLSRERWWIAAIPAAAGFMCNVAYASVTAGRYLNWPMALSAIPFVFPGMAFWASGFPSIGVSIASIVWTSPATDAMQPFAHGDRNEFPYAFDVVVVVSNFIGCIVAGVAYVRCAFDKLGTAQACGFVAWCVAIWALPISVWIHNSTTLAKDQKSESPDPRFWERGAIIWHIAASGTCFVGGLSGYYVCHVL